MTWKPEAGKPALVMVADITDHHSTLIDGDSYGCGHYRIPSALLSEPPTPVTTEQLAVIKAAKRQEEIFPFYTVAYEKACRETNIAVRNLRASEAPPDPKAELLAAVKAMIEKLPGGHYDGLSDVLYAIRAIEADDGK